MAAYTTPNLNDYLPGEPLTSAKALLMVENPIAIAEGATGAPRVSPKAQGRKPILASGTTPVNISDFSAYEGVTLHIKARNGSGSSANVSLALSSDGVSFSSSTLIATAAGSSNGTIAVFVDFSTGDLYSAYEFSGGTPGTYNGTAGLPGGTISHIRITDSLGSSVSLSVLTFPSAGEVA